MSNNNNSVSQYYDISNTSSLCSLTKLSLLTLINLAVVLENVFVILAVTSSRRLRKSNRNLLILSLSVADLLLGVCVLPASIYNSYNYDHSRFGPNTFTVDELKLNDHEIPPSFSSFDTTLKIKRKIIDGFGWCIFWHLFDAWFSTASIYSLVVITIDRFLAVSFPLKYKVIANRQNAVSMANMFIWTTSILIALPVALMASDGEKLEDEFIANFRHGESTCGRRTTSVNKIYAVFYCISSFYVPFLVVLVFYAKIYHRIRRVAKSMVDGFLDVPGRKLQRPAVSRVGSKRSVERESSVQDKTKLDGRTSVSSSVAADEGDGKSKTKSCDMLRVHAGGYSRRAGTNQRNQMDCERKASSDPASAETAVSRAISLENPAPTETRFRSVTWTCRKTYVIQQVDRPQIKVTKYDKNEQTNNNNNNNKISITAPKVLLPYQNSAQPAAVKNSELWVCQKLTLKGVPCGYNNIKRKASIANKLSSNSGHHKSSPGVGLKHAVAEIKAIRTVGLVIGCFLFCWSGYSSMFLYAVFVGPSQQSGQLLTFFTWLGYSNSAINPFIYAICNRQYRKSFKNICFRLLNIQSTRPPVVRSDKLSNNFNGLQNSVSFLASQGSVNASSSPPRRSSYVNQKRPDE